MERLHRKPPEALIPEEIVRRLAAQESKEPHQTTVHQAKAYILKHIQEDICVDDIAGEVHLNASYLMRLFKKETGRSLLEYITDERVRLARDLLLDTDYPINQVADAVGYGNYSYFTRIFKRSVGVTPKKYREEMR